MTIILDVEGRLQERDEPRPCCRILALGHTESDGENLTVPIERGHDNERPAVVRLNVTGIQAAYFRRLSKGVPADGWADKRP